MDVRQIREATILLPSDDDDELTPADQPPNFGDIIGLAVYDADWSRLQAADRDISGCRLTSVSLADAHFEDGRITNTVFDDCDFASARWTNLKIDRCVFRGSRLMGLQTNKIILGDVIFERCRFDYATLAGLRATGAIAFVDCMLRETAIEDSRLEGAVFADCPMPGAQLARTKMRGADLRGSTIDTLAGVACLTGTTLDNAQIPQLTQAFLVDLQVDIKY